MELSCDEAVLRRMGAAIRADYAASLLRLSTAGLPGMPLAFGESDPKQRIKNVLAWRKPALWVLALAAGLAAIGGGLLLVNAAARRRSWAERTTL